MQLLTRASFVAVAAFVLHAGVARAQANPPRSGFLALPFLGVHSHQGASGDNQDPGLRLGTLLGGRVGGGMFSINGEVTLDLLNLATVPSGVSTTVIELDLALSPLVHLSAGSGEIVLGPKLGFWVGAAELSSGMMTAKASATGFVAGLNAGAFVPISNSVSLGGITSFVFRTINKSCVTTPGAAEICNSDPNEPSEKIISLAAALLI